MTGRKETAFLTQNMKEEECGFARGENRYKNGVKENENCIKEQTNTATKVIFTSSSIADIHDPSIIITLQALKAKGTLPQ